MGKKSRSGIRNLFDPGPGMEKFGSGIRDKTSRIRNTGTMANVTGGNPFFVKYRAVPRVNRFSGWREEDVRQVVASCDKQRFALKEDAATGLLLIRANQGRSIRDVVVDMEEIRCAADAPDKVIHGTTRGAWEAIREQGLSRMRRQHIHCAAGEPGDAGVISGMRKACQIFIYIDVAAALADGFKFYRSANNVILCPGNEAGILPARYFAKVKDMRKNLVIFP
jgi:2'-phosphotransferase